MEWILDIAPLIPTPAEKVLKNCCKKVLPSVVLRGATTAAESHSKVEDMDGAIAELQTETCSNLVPPWEHLPPQDQLPTGFKNSHGIPPYGFNSLPSQG